VEHRPRLPVAALALLLAWPAFATAATEDAARAAFERGFAALRAGAYEQAAASLEQAAADFAGLAMPAQEAESLLRLAEAQQALGDHRKAGEQLLRAHALAEASADAPLRAAILGGLGNVSAALGELDAAGRHLEAALALSPEAEAPALRASLLNNRANLLAFEARYDEALAGYRESARLARAGGSATLEARALANGARAAADSGDLPAARSLAAQGAARTRELADPGEKTTLLIDLGRIETRLAAEPGPEGAAARRRAHELLGSALETARSSGDGRATSHALGYFGALYEGEGRHDEALELTRRALFEAQGGAGREGRHRWSWQAARLLLALGRREEALDALRRAVGDLQELRHQSVLAYGPPGATFATEVAPAYRQLVDLLLQQAAGAATPEAADALLWEARDTLERLDAAELRDYFRDECVDALQAKVRRAEELSASTALVYPILLPGRVELLLILPPRRILRVSSAVEPERVTAEVRELRRLLEKRVTREYLAPARRLHDWLIAPLADALAGAGIDTLVFIPDGPLRTVPMSALHDGESFLIERYAVATTPGADLTDPRPLAREDLRALLVGLSEPRAGFASLERVPEELKAIEGLLPADILLDDGFRLEPLEQALGNQRLNILHVATHGEFVGRSHEGYLLTWDGRLSLDELQDLVGVWRFRDTPLELISLSACETAAGDDRAALGLSGIAVKTGARSALGTLWKVDDEAASLLVVDFYRRLGQEGVSRAAALRAAQREMLKDLRFRHPGHWSAFLLISNWL
jgi:CHAT domain-containing protein